MYIFLIIIHVIMCIVLIMVVLLQAGRGGGFSEMLGGGAPSSILGTDTNRFMTRATEVCAVMFIITSLVLGVMSTQRGKSLIDKRRLNQSAKTQMPLIPEIPKTDAKAAPVAAAAPVTAPAAPEAPAALPVQDAQPNAAK